MNRNFNSSTTGISRRQFLALGAAGVAASSLSPLQPVSAALERQALPEKRGGTGRIYADAFVLQDGRLRGTMIVSIDPQTGRWRQIVRDAYIPSVSRDARQIAWMKDEQTYIAPVDAPDTAKRLAGFPAAPVWLPGGKHVIVSYAGRTWNIAADGSKREPVELPDGHLVLDCSADGKLLLTSLGEYPDSLLHVVPLDGKKPRRVVDTAADGRFSPDGRRIVFDRMFRGGIFTIRIDGTDERSVFDETDVTMLEKPRFSPDGKRIAFILNHLSDDGRGRKVLESDPKTANPTLMIVNADGSKPARVRLADQEGMKIWPAYWIDWR